MAKQRKTAPERPRAATYVPSPNHPAAASAQPSRRWLAVDMLRGFALLLMFVYHFSFDLNHFGAIRIDFNREPFWLGFRASIVSLFLGLVGVGMILADLRGFRWQGYLKRLAAIGACAVLVSLGSYWMFPESFIFFGILHFIFFAGILGRGFVKFYWTNLILGAAFLVVGLIYSHPVFDQPGLQWFGLMTHKPITQDYVPLLPWFGVVLIGMFVARVALDCGLLAKLSSHTPGNRVGRALAFGGRHSLIVYMLHQPIFIATLWVIFHLLRA